MADRCGAFSMVLVLVVFCVALWLIVAGPFSMVLVLVVALWAVVLSCPLSYCCV